MAMTDGFYHLSASWYGEANLKGADYVDEVIFGWFDTDGGVLRDHAEITMRWHMLQGEATPRLEVFSDAFKTLARYSELINELQHWNNNFDPEDFCELLKDFGFKDLTKRERNF